MNTASNKQTYIIIKKKKNNSKIANNLTSWKKVSFEQWLKNMNSWCFPDVSRKFIPESRRSSMEGTITSNSFCFWNVKAKQRKSPIFVIPILFFIFIYFLLCFGVLFCLFLFNCEIKGHHSQKVNIYLLLEKWLFAPFSFNNQPTQKTKQKTKTKTKQNKTIKQNL